MSIKRTPTILVIEDDPIYRDFVSTLLRTAGLRVREAVDGAQGERILRTETFDLVITDLVMPNKDGIEVVRELLKTADSIPIVVLSGRDGGEEKRYSKLVTLLGASAFLPKFDAAKTILPTIRELLPDWTPPAR